MSVITNPIFLSIFGTGLVLAVCIGAYRWKQFQRRIVAWQSFANQRGLDFNASPGFFKYAPGTLTMQGVYQGLPFLLCTEYRGGGDTRHVVTLLQLELGAALPRGLVLKPEHMGHKTLQLFGYKDEEVGDEALDEALLLENVTPQARAMLVAPRVRGPLLKLGQAYSGFSIEAGFLRVEKAALLPETAMELDAFMAPALLLARAVQATEAYTGARMRG